MAPMIDISPSQPQVRSDHAGLFSDRQGHVTPSESDPLQKRSLYAPRKSYIVGILMRGVAHETALFHAA